MATIFYAVMGEGRGHAARARSMVEALRHRHRMVLYSSFDALEFLRKEYAADPGVEVRETNGIKFHYKGGRLDLLKTIRSGLGLWWNLQKSLDHLAGDFVRDRPDLVVTDFEPTLARAAHRAGVPVMSLDHQHFLTTYDLSSLPADLRRWARAMSLAVWMFGLGQQSTVVSAFYRPPLRPGVRGVTQVGPLLRPAVRERSATRGEHILSYLRRATPDAVIEGLATLGPPVRVYGLGARPPRGGVTFHEIDERAFLDDLAGCDAVVAAAGNQLLGEALHFGKPFLALPEALHHEQRINACFLAQLGGGEWELLHRCTADTLRAFYARRDEHRARLAASGLRFDGTQEAAEAIEAVLAGSGRPAPPQA